MRSQLSLVFLGLSSLQSIYAHQDVLFTSSVSYCAPPTAIIIQQFDVSYFADNTSVVFNVTASSVEPGLTVTANVLLNVYGLKPLNLTFDFCNDLGGTLCPLPLYNFSGAGSIPLPSDVDVGGRVPTIAYKIPDLEAFAQINLTDVRTGDVKACIQTTLSNGWSTRQPAVSWATQGVAIATFLAVLVHLTLSAQSMIAIRFLDLIYLYQHVCFTGMLALDYPILYLSYTLNFSWAVGLFPNFGSLQQAIDVMRRRTGGHVDPPASPSGTTDRKLSPYNAFIRGIALNPTQSPATGDTTMPAIVTSPADTLPAGIATYTNSLGISEGNAFMTMFLDVLVLMACLLAFLGMVHLALRLLFHGSTTPRTRWLPVAVSLLLFCLATLSFAPTFVFFQWTLRDSWLSALISAVVCVISATAVILQATAIPRMQRLVFDRRTLVEVASLGYQRSIGTHKLPQLWPLYLSTIIFPLKSLLIGFGQKSGATQIFGLLVIELFQFVTLTICRSFRSKRSNVFSISLCGTRVVTFALLVPFLTQLGVKPIPRVVIGIIGAIILSIAILATIFNVAMNAVLPNLTAARSDEAATLNSFDGSGSTTKPEIIQDKVMENT